MLRFRTFGTIDLRRPDGERLEALLDQPKRLALLAYLAAHQRAGPVRREQVVSLLWPDSSPASAREALSTTLSRLRQALGPEAVRGRGTETIGLSGERFRSDAAAFEAAVEAGRSREAADLYQGPFLEGFRPPDVRPFEEWMARRRDEYAQTAYRAAMEAAGEAREAEEWAAAEACLRKAREIEPHREEAARALMELFAEQGDRALALQAFEDFRARLGQDLGLSPSDELRSRAEALRSSRPVEQETDDSSPTEPAVDRTETSRGSTGTAGETESAAPDTEPRSMRSDRGGGRTFGDLLPSRRTLLVLTGVLLWGAGARWLLYTASGSDGATSAGSREPGPAKTSVAVLPFEVSGAASETWGDGMVTLVSTGLDGAPELRAIADRTVFAAWQEASSGSGATTTKEALTVARRLGARYAVVGSVVQLGAD